MALFTKLFKRSHDPYELTGRWHRYHVKNDAVVMDAEALEVNASIFDGSYTRRLKVGARRVPVMGFIVPNTTLSSNIGTSLNNFIGADNSSTNIVSRIQTMGCFYNVNSAGYVGLPAANTCSDYYVYVYTIEVSF